MNRSHTKITKSSLDQIKIQVPLEGNKILEKVVIGINSNDEIKTLWKIMNVNAIDRLGMTDHGPTHFQIVAGNGIKLARLFEAGKVEFSIVTDFGLTKDYAETVIFLGCVMHDLGMSIHREGHEEFSLFLSNRLLQDILSFLPIEEKTVVISETLHAIIGHRSGGSPKTVEAGIVRFADALDMVKGRSRVSYGRGEMNIHSVSHHAIEALQIEKGDTRPVEIKVHMSNPAGMFQIDDLMQDKLKGSGIEKYIKVSAYLTESGRERLFKEFEF